MNPGVLSMGFYVARGDNPSKRRCYDSCRNQAEVRCCAETCPSPPPPSPPPPPPPNPPPPSPPPPTTIAPALPPFNPDNCGTEVCLRATIKTRAFASEISWELRSKSEPVAAVWVGPQDGRPYEDNRQYQDSTCVPCGEYELRLMDSYGDSWEGGSLDLFADPDLNSGCTTCLSGRQNFSKL